MTLAKQIVNETGFRSGGSLEDIFARARESERENETFLVDEEWRAAAGKPGPADAGPTEEETKDPKPERERPVTFSWAEFMAQPVETGKRRRKGPEAPSLFEWAVEQEVTAQRGG